MPLNFMMHCGANHVERPALQAVEVPEETDSYKPLPYNQFVDTIEDQLGDIGFRFGEQAYAVNYRKNRASRQLDMKASQFFGIAELLFDGGHADSHALVVGMRSSLDMSLAPSVSFGSQVFVCDNLSFTGEVVIKRKQTANSPVDLPLLIQDAVSRVQLMKQNQDIRFEHYQHAQLRGNKADALIVEMYRRGIVNPARMGKVIEQWDEPDHDFGGRTGWRLFNATTEALKGAPTFEIPRRTIELQNLMDEATSFEPLPMAA